MLGSVFSAAPLAAQIVPTGFQEYYLTGHTEQVYEMFDFIADSEGGPLPTPAGMNSTITLTATTDIQVVIYDHWEDGYETAILTPSQASTLILGDGVVGNGDASGFGGLAGDLINVDVALTWQSTAVGAAGTIAHFVPYPRPAFSSPVAANELRYDAPDRLVVIGGPVNLAYAMDPLSPFMADASLVLAREILGSTTSYVVPVGAEQWTAAGAYASFRYVFLQLVSYADGVTVTVDNGLDPSVTFNLDEGDSWSSRGMINQNVDPAAALAIRAGTQVTASGPLAAFVVTGGAGTYQTRLYTLLPEALFANEYIIPVYGDAANVNGDREANLYVYNPHPTPLAVTAVDRTGTVTLNVPAGGIAAFTEAAPVGAGRDIPANSTVRLSASQSFWGIGSIDYLGTASDWGYGMVPVNLLNDAISTSWAPGNGVTPLTAQPNAAPIWISPTLDDTLVEVDLNGDGVFDQISTDGDVNDTVEPFATGTTGYLVDALFALRIFDPDHDQTGVRIRANNKFVAAYGQDTEVAAAGSPQNALDLGYNMMPQDDRFLDSILQISLSSDVPSVPPTGGPVVFTMTVSASQGPVTDIDVQHLLPAGWTYVAGSTVVTHPDGSLSNPDPGIAGSLLTWALGEEVLAGEVLTITFTADCPAGAATGPHRHRSFGFGDYAGWPLRPWAQLRIIKGQLRVTLTPSATVVRPGDPLSYTAAVTNVGTSNINGVVLEVPVPTDTTFNSATLGTFNGPCRCVIVNAGNLAGAASVTTTVNTTVTASAAIGSSIRNIARATASNSPEVFSAEVSTLVRAPDLAATLQGPAFAITGYPHTYRVQLRNLGNEAATGVFLTMAVPIDTAYVSGSLALSTAGGPFVPQSDAADGDAAQRIVGTPDVIRLDFASFAIGADVTLRFRVTTTGPDGNVITAVAQTDSNETPLESSNVITSLINNSGDADGDGLSNGDEIAIHLTDPLDRDSDDDGVSDGAEVLGTLGSTSDPLLPDTDGDGLCDGTELGVTVAGADTDPFATCFQTDLDNTTQTDPLARDTDDGGIDDGVEDLNHNGRIDSGEGDPVLWDDDDPDLDGLDNGTEDLDGDQTWDVGLESDPDDGDTDDDGLADGAEVDWDLSSDGDALINAIDPDSDDDGLSDGLELGITAADAHPDTDQSSPNFAEDSDPSTTTAMDVADTDSDGVLDGDEDADGDGFVDTGVETDPNLPDTDGDGALDGTDNCPVLANPAQDDAEPDGLGDACDPDDDNDGVADALDNCPLLANPTQDNLDGDLLGDACDLDDDGDGHDGGPDDCDDRDDTVYSGAPEVCDGVDNDCDLAVPADEDDPDGDLYVECEPWAGGAPSILGGDDCAPGDAAINPGATELMCNGVDEDCDPLTIDDPGPVDDDGDGVTVCAGDCDDGDANVNPGRTEHCADGVDNDCDTLIDDLDLDQCPPGCDDLDGDGYPGVPCGTDCDDAAASVHPDGVEQCVDGYDNDCDTFIDFDDSECPPGCDDDDSDGYLAVSCGGLDCDDDDDAVSPGAAEHCSNGRDDNCNGLTDTADLADCPDLCADGDGDGYADLACGGTDCNDDDPNVSPGAGEAWCDGSDNDCNAVTLDPPDEDRDGFVAETCPPGADCDDGVALINPDAGEHCADTLDNNCDGLVDASDPLCPDNCEDDDGDGYPFEDCGGSDCDDGAAGVHPGAGEHCGDGLDNDCDDLTDDADVGDCPPGCIDLDLDGYPWIGCGGTDCDDDRAEVAPGAGENCSDGLDNDCNGLIDDADPASCPFGCGDGDGDGYPDAICGGADCDDTDAAIHPGSFEHCTDGDDNDCNGLADGLDPTCPFGCDDDDGDGFLDAACGGLDCDDGNAAANPAASELACNGVDDDCSANTPDDADPADADGDSFTRGCGGDCDDGAAGTHPQAAERCNDGLDNDCDGDIDADDTGGCPPGCADADGDGYPDTACGGTDCDDAHDEAHAGAIETCDGIDNDCDGEIDDGEGEGFGDADGDGIADCVDEDGGGGGDGFSLVGGGCRCDGGLGPFAGLTLLVLLGSTRARSRRRARPTADRPASRW